MMLILTQATEEGASIIFIAKNSTEIEIQVHYKDLGAFVHIQRRN